MLRLPLTSQWYATRVSIFPTLLPILRRMAMILFSAYATMATVISAVPVHELIKWWNLIREKKQVIKKINRKFKNWWELILKSGGNLEQWERVRFLACRRLSLHCMLSPFRFQATANKIINNNINYPKLASVVQLVRTSSIMRVVTSSSPDWSENFIIFHVTYDSW